MPLQSGDEGAGKGGETCESKDMEVASEESVVRSLRLSRVLDLTGL